MTTTRTGSTLDHGIGPDGLFSIRMRDGNLRLRGVDGDTIRIRERHDHDLSAMFEMEPGDGSLSLRALGRTDFLGRGSRSHTPELEVDLPRRATVVVETGSVDVHVDGLVGDQRYRSASGDLSLREVSGQIAVDGVSGDIDMFASGDVEVDLRTVSGDVQLRAATIRALQVTTTSGDLKVTGRLAGPGPFTIVTVSGDALLAPVGDGRIEMTTLSGDLRSTIGSRSDAGRGRRSVTIGTGGPLVDVRTMSGDLRVVRPERIGLPSELPHLAEAPAQHPHVARVAGETPAAAGSASRPVSGSDVGAKDDARLRILRSLERGEIDVTEAGRRLEALDSGLGGAAGRPEGPPDA